jgi:hypothetical protein
VANEDRRQPTSQTSIPKSEQSDLFGKPRFTQPEGLQVSAQPPPPSNEHVAEDRVIDSESSEEDGSESEDEDEGDDENEEDVEEDGGDENKPVTLRGQYRREERHRPRVQ